MLNVNVDLVEFERIGPARQRRIVKAVAALEMAIESPMVVFDAPEMLGMAVPDREAVEQ